MKKKEITRLPIAGKLVLIDKYFPAMLLFGLLFFLFGTAEAQINNGNDTLAVYQKLVESFNNADGRLIIIPNRALNSELKKFNFRSPEQYILNGKFPLRRDTAWNRFLIFIDVGSIADSAIIDQKVALIPHVKRTEGAADFARYRKPEFDAFGVLEMSQVLFSDDGKKAVCIARLIQSSDAIGSCIYFFELKDNEWQIVFKITLSMT